MNTLLSKLMKRLRVIQKSNNKKMIVQNVCTMYSVSEAYADIAEKKRFSARDTFNQYTRDEFSHYFKEHGKITRSLGLEGMLPEVVVCCEDDFPQYQKHYVHLACIYLNALSAYLSLGLLGGEGCFFNRIQTYELIISGNWLNEVNYVETYRKRIVDRFLTLLYPDELIKETISEQNLLCYRKEHLYAICSGMPMLKKLSLKDLMTLAMGLYCTLGYEHPLIRMPLPASKVLNKYPVENHVVDRIKSMDDLHAMDTLIRYTLRLFSGIDSVYSDNFPYREITLKPINPLEGESKLREFYRQYFIQPLLDKES